MQGDQADPVCWGALTCVYLTLSECGGSVGSPGSEAKPSPLTSESLRLRPRSPLSPLREGLSRSTGLPSDLPLAIGCVPIPPPPPCSGQGERQHLHCLPQYKVLLYSLDGRLLSAYCAYEWSLGVKSVAWSPSSQFLAIGSYDGKVRPSSTRGDAVGTAPARGPHAHSPLRCASLIT